MLDSDDAKVIIVLICFFIFILIMSLAPSRQDTLVNKCLELAKDHKQVIECQKEIGGK